MIRSSYLPDDAEALAPLLHSIGRELEERGARLAELETGMDELKRSPFFESKLRDLQAEAAEQRRALRECRKELDRLGCSVVGTAPLTIRIPTREGDARGSLVWQQGQDRRN